MQGRTPDRLASCSVALIPVLAGKGEALLNRRSWLRRLRWLAGGVHVLLAIVSLLLLLATAAWPVVPAVLALIGAVYVGQWLGRRRVLAAQATGQGRWEGYLDTMTAAWFWNAGRVALFSYRGGFPCRLTGDALGLTVAPRGLLLPRMRRYQTVSIPWTDIAGGRQQTPVHRNRAGQFSVLPLTEMTIDVVGATARGLNDLSEIDGEPDAGEVLDYLRGIYGPQWQPGTVPVTAMLSSPEGLLDLIVSWAQGTPCRVPSIQP